MKDFRHTGRTVSPVKAFEPPKKKEIRYDTDIMGQQTLPEARIEAAKTPTTKARIVRALHPFFVVADGQKCPCCKAIAELEFE